MSMSRSLRRQVLGAGLIHGVTAAAMAPDASLEVVKIGQSLDALADAAVDLAMSQAGNRRNERGQWVLDRKEEVARQRSLNALIRAILGQYSAVVDMRDFLSSAMKWIEDLREDLPPTPPKRAAVWADIAGGLQSLYEQYDPEGTAWNVIDAGAARGEQFQHVSGVW